VAGLAILMTVVVGIVVSGLRPGGSPNAAESQDPSPGQSQGAIQSLIARSPAPTASVRCSEELGPLAQGLTGVACPSAIVAVELAVAPVRLPIERIVVDAGPFYCGVLWPGVQTAPDCRGYAVLPGQFMHAWVSFTGSPKVGAVMLGLDLPPAAVPGATRPPWSATLVTAEIPPDGWVMP
jgi:hypothetical protein